MSEDGPDRSRDRRPDRAGYWDDEADGGPSIGPAVVGLVGGSAGLIGLQAGASTVEIGVLVAAGAAVGGALYWYLRRIAGEVPGRRVRR